MRTQEIDMGNARWRTPAVILVSLAAGALLGLIAAAAPFGAHLDWPLLSDVGQAFGTLSALPSAIALIGVLGSLRLQRQQTRVARLEVVRMIRSQLIQFGFDRPQYRQFWGYEAGLDAEEMKQRAYISMVFSYLKMAYVVGVLTERELRASSRVAFGHAPVATFWREGREFYLGDTFSPESRRFAVIADGSYQDAVPMRHR